MTRVTFSKPQWAGEANRETRTVPGGREQAQAARVLPLLECAAGLLYSLHGEVLPNASWGLLWVFAFPVVM